MAPANKEVQMFICKFPFNKKKDKWHQIPVHRYLVLSNILYL